MLMLLERGQDMADLSTLEGFHKRWVEVFNSHDLDAHAALYTEDAMLFGAVPELMIGRAAIRGYFAGRGPKAHVAQYPFPRVVMISDLWRQQRRMSILLKEIQSCPTA